MTSRLWSGPNPSEPGRPTRDMDELFGWIICTTRMELKLQDMEETHQIKDWIAKRLTCEN